MATTSTPYSGHPPTLDGPVLPSGGPRRRWQGRDVAVALVLIGLGLFFLAVNTVSLGGSALFLVLGAAFAAARVLSGRYGYAVPAGVLLGFGAFVALDDAGLLPGESQPWFFYLLAAGFLGTYVIGARPAAVWPLFSAAALAAFGALLSGGDLLAPLASYTWTAQYWPLALVALGGWLLLRDRLAPHARRPVGLLLLGLFVLYGVLVVGAALAAGSPAAGAIGAGVRGPLAWPGRYTVTTTLAAPAAGGDTLRVNTPGGRVTLRGGTGTDVRATATKHFWNRDQAPDVRLSRSGGAFSLEATARPAARSWFGNVAAARVDFDVEVPPGVRVEARTGSGDVVARDLSGSVAAETGSGSIDLARVAGDANATTGSGSLRLLDVGGEARATTGSGAIRVQDVPRLRQAFTGSGEIRLSGALSGDTRLQTGSGSVTVALAPSSSLRVTATTDSGEVRVRDLPLTDQRLERRSVAGTLGSGSGTLVIHTGSGPITLSATR